MDDLLKDLGILEKPIKTDNGYAIDIQDSDDYARYYSKLDRSDLVEEDEDSSQITMENSSIQYNSVDGKYNFTLLADFDGDIYTLTIQEN